MQSEHARGEGGFEEDWKMEVDEEVERKKKFDEQRKRLQKQLRKIEEFTDMDPVCLEGQKEKWQQDLQEIEQQRNDPSAGAPKDAEKGLKSC